MAGFYEKNVHEFKGKVTIQDIQNEFNSLVSAINLLVIDINELDQYKDRDYSEGSENIPSSNYTLTLGALKKILDAYNGCFIGGTCVESPITPGEIITFPMLRVSNTEGIEQIANTSIRDNDKAGIDIYYDTVNKNLKLDNNLTENCVKVTPIDWNRDEWILNTTEDDLFVNPDTSPVIKVTPVPYAGHSSIPCQTNQGNMVVPSLPFGANIGINLCGVNIQYYGNIGSKNYSYINTYSPIWIPKGMHDKINPYRDCKALAYTIDIKGGNS